MKKYYEYQIFDKENLRVSIELKDSNRRIIKFYAYRGETPHGPGLIIFTDLLTEERDFHWHPTRGHSKDLDTLLNLYNKDRNIVSKFVIHYPDGVTRIINASVECWKQYFNEIFEKTTHIKETHNGTPLGCLNTLQ